MSAALAASLAKADLRKRLLGKITRGSTIPTGLGWDTPNYPLTIGLYDVPGSPRAIGTSSLTAKSAFDAVSTARSAPGATFYVTNGGNDGTGTGAVGAPFKSIWKAVQAANTAGVPSKVIVDVSGGAYSFARANNPSFGSVWPTVDIAFIASGGRVQTGVFDSFTNPTTDATYTNCYTFAITASTVNRVADIGNRNSFGNYPELVKVADAATCNVTPGSWAHVSGTVYIHRADGAAVTTSNTRYYRTGSTAFYFSTTTNHIYIGGASGNDGWDIEGGHVNGVLTTGFSTGVFGTSDHVLAVENCSFKYGGGAIDNTVGRGVSVDSWRGLAIFQNCRADANMTDGFNFHNSFGAAKCLVLTVNCTAADNGRASNQSCNGLTLHDDLIAIDIAGNYEYGHGGTIRNINTSRHLLVGTRLAHDLGDIMFGGTIKPTAIGIDDTTEMWCDRVRVEQPAGTYAYTTRGAGAKIHRRDCWPVSQPDHGPGTIDSY